MYLSYVVVLLLYGVACGILEDEQYYAEDAWCLWCSYAMKQYWGYSLPWC